MRPEDLNSQAETLALINAEVTARLGRQSVSLDKIDTKSVLLVGYALAAISFLTTRGAESVLAVLAYCAFASAVGFGVASMSVRAYEDVGPRPLFNKYADLSVPATLAALGATKVKHFEFNNGQLRRKARRWWASLAILLVGTALMVTAIFVQTYRHDHTGRVGRHRSRGRRAGRAAGSARRSGFCRRPCGGCAGRPVRIRG